MFWKADLAKLNRKIHYFENKQRSKALHMRPTKSLLHKMEGSIHRLASRLDNFGAQTVWQEVRVHVCESTDVVLRLHEFAGGASPLTAMDMAKIWTACT